MNSPVKRGYTTKLRTNFKSKEDFVSYITDAGGEFTIDILNAKKLVMVKGEEGVESLKKLDCRYSGDTGRPLLYPIAYVYYKNEEGRLEFYAYVRTEDKDGYEKISLAVPIFSRIEVKKFAPYSRLETHFASDISIKHKRVIIADKQAYLEAHQIVNKEGVAKLRKEYRESRDWFTKRCWFTVIGAILMLWFLSQLAGPGGHILANKKLAVLSLISFAVGKKCELKQKKLDSYTWLPDTFV